ncbi:hypothetical protein AN642_01555 [Epulopiscium sp. SCG-B10WGA-EpuloA2]|nr:hypothetical protein AN642_01555 [Epulopiscium sp. SCG-B10WGA-EpuloA2]
MNKKILSMLAVLVTGSALFTACGGSDETNSSDAKTESPKEATLSPEGYPIAEKQELTYNLGSEPLTIDPQLNSAVDGGQVINNNSIT